MIKDEKKLVEEVRAGSEASFRALYDYWVSKLYWFVYRYVKSKAVTDDIVQETFLRVWMHRDNLNPDLSFKSYLFAVSYHLLLKELRRQLNQPLMEDFMAYRHEEQEIENKGEWLVDYEVFCKALEEAKLKLSPRQREIFEMNKELNLSVHYIAEKLSITEQVVRNQLSAALKTIRLELTHYSCMLVLFLLDL